MVTEAGDLLMCGCGEFGRLGLGDEEDRATPTRVARAVFDGEAVLMVACGYDHTVVATEGGSVYTFGRGYDGGLGHGDEENQLTPKLVSAAGFHCERIVMVAAGGGHTVALSEAGHVFTWGRGCFGQLGHNDQKKQLAPRQVKEMRFSSSEGIGGQGDNIVFVAAGDNHTVAVSAVGLLYTWGSGVTGRLGHGDTDHRLVPTLVGGFRGPGGGEVVMAACGAVHTLVVTKDGGLWACGLGENGQLGLDDDEYRHVFERVGGTTNAVFNGAKVVAAAAGGYHSAAVTEDGALWTWGNGGFGQLGRGDDEGCLVPRDSLGDLRIGRCRVLPKAHAFAFLMGTKRQKQGTVTVKNLAGEASLVPMICRWCTTVLPGLAGGMEGLMRLCGGFHAWKQRRAAAGQ
jgi:RCC1 and BTB domain-containing protein